MTSARRVKFRCRANWNLCTHSLTRKVIFELVEDYSIHIFHTTPNITNFASCTSYYRTDYNEWISEASACRSTTIECFFETAVLDTENEASHSSSVTSLFAMFQVKGSSITAAHGSVTFGKSNSVMPICECRNRLCGSIWDKEWQY